MWLLMGGWRHQVTPALCELSKILVLIKSWNTCEGLGNQILGDSATAFFIVILLLGYRQGERCRRDRLRRRRPRRCRRRHPPPPLLVVVVVIIIIVIQKHSSSTKSSDHHADHEAAIQACH